MQRALVVILALGCGCGSSRTPPLPDDRPAVPAAEPAAPAPAPATTEVRVDRRIELLSILHRLGGGDEYRQAPPSPYVAAVDQTFGPFRAHPAVSTTAALRARHGISYDAPMHLAVHLDDGLRLVNAEELIRVEPRWRGVDVEAYVASVRDFAAATKLDAFLATHRAHHEAVAAKLRAVVDAEHPVGWFDALFGQRARSRYVVVPGMLTGASNFGPSVTLPDGTLEMFQVLGVRGADGLPLPDTETLELLIHEMAHAYINPVFEQHRAALEAAGSALYALVAEPMRAQAYASWMTMLNESGVRAVTVLYMLERKGAEAGATAARGELRRSFVWINELVEMLRRYQRDRARYPDLDAYMPQLVAFFGELVTSYGGSLPPRPFLGPVNAGLQGEVAFAVPARDPALAKYVRALHGKLFPTAPLLVASEQTLAQTAGKHLVVYGTPGTNPVIAAVAGWAGWTFAPDGISLGAKRIAGEDLVLAACWFRRDDPTRGVVVYAGADQADLVGINHLRHGTDDWLVARRTAKGFEVVERGNWPLSNGALTPPY